MEKITPRLLLDVHEKPDIGQGLLLSFQHVFAMFGATVLVPLLLGMSVSTALLASGIGTFIYMVATQFKVPVYLGSSFAYIQAMAFAKSQLGGEVRESWIVESTNCFTQQRRRVEAMEW